MSTQGTLQKKDQKEGKKGPYYFVEIDGIKMAAFGKASEAVAPIPVGSTVQYTYKQSGQYTNLESISQAGVGNQVATTTGAGNAAPVGGGRYGSRDPLEVNLMMVTRYALDAQISDKALTPTTGVKLVFDTIDAVKKAMTPALKKPKSDEAEFRTAAENVAKALGIDLDTAMWTEYVKKSKGAWVTIMQDMADVHGNRAELLITPDGHMAVTRVA